MAIGSFPDYTGIFTGMDTRNPAGGRNIDLFKSAFKNAALDPSQYLSQSVVASPAFTTFDTGSATGKMLDIAKAIQDFEQARYPFELNKYREMTDIAAQQQLKQMRQLYPFLSAAGAESTERYLDASTRFLIRKEQMPSKIGELMALKQAQATSAAAGEADRARAIAAQQDAANRYAGQVFKSSVA